MSGLVRPWEVAMSDDSATWAAQQGESPEEILDGSQMQEMLSTDELVKDVYEETFAALLEEDPELEALRDDPEFLQMVWEEAQASVDEEFGS
jgi:hypothetical protein